MMDAARFNEATVEALALAAGIELAPDRRAIVAQRLNEMHELAEGFQHLAYGDVDPAFAFDASWPDDAR
jgi:hypothetical protein